MFATFRDPFEALFTLQRALDARFASDWMGRGTAAGGSFPPINIFQKGEDLVAVVELPGNQEIGTSNFDLRLEYLSDGTASNPHRFKACVDAMFGQMADRCRTRLLLRQRVLAQRKLIRMRRQRIAICWGCRLGSRAFRDGRSMLLT